MRLGRGVVDDRRAGRERGGHERVLGAHHRRLVHEEVARAQAARRRDDRVRGARRARRRRRARGTRRGAGRAGGGRSRRRRAAACARGRGARAAAPRSRNDARMRSESTRSTSLPVTFSALSATTWSSRHSTLTPRRSSRASIVSTSLDARHVAHDDLLLGEQRGRQRGQRAVLVAGGHDRPRERPAALDDELLHEAEGTAPTQLGSAPCNRLARKHGSSSRNGSHRTRCASTCWASRRRWSPTRASGARTRRCTPSRACSTTSTTTATPTSTRATRGTRSSCSRRRATRRS